MIYFLFFSGDILYITHHIADTKGHFVPIQADDRNFAKHILATSEHDFSRKGAFFNLS